MRTVSVLALAILAACGGDATDEPPAGAAADERPAAGDAATALASSFDQPSARELEEGRLDSSWRRWAEEDARTRAATRPGPSAPGDSAPAAGETGGTETAAGTGGPGAPSPDSASWEDISPQAVNGGVTGLPISGDVEGPAVARVQVLLDRVRFRPGVIDGRWGKNTEKAVYWFQNERGIEPTGSVDRATLDRLEREAGLGDRLVIAHTLTETDVQGPFVQLPEDVYERAEQDCLCYESLREKLGEVFHASPELLEQLNPDLDLNAVSAGDRLQVPNVEPFRLAGLPDGKLTPEQSRVERIVISDGGHYLHALGPDGDILYHFPTTLGADYSPSPTGEFSVRSITFDPTWHYQPELLTGVDPGREDAILPAGPNNAVGVVWMQLSRDHYGIHGTAAPETIGYVTSNGCVRLTNWDAALLGQDIPPGVPVEFRDVNGR